MARHLPPCRSLLCAGRVTLVLVCSVIVGRGAKEDAGSNAGGGFLGSSGSGSGSSPSGNGPLPSDNGFEDKVASFSHDIEARVQHLNDSPRIYQVDDFLSPAECDFMKWHGAEALRPSLTIDRETGEYHPDTVRTNQQMYVSKEESRDHPMIASIVRRLHRLARIPLGHGEQIQVGRYLVGEKYDCHYDSEPSVNVIRPATIIIYVSEVKAGGDTIFPMGVNCQPLSLCCQGNATLPVRRLHPKKGRAILFYSHDLDGRLNMDAMHGSCPVEEGEKWIVQAWFRASLYPMSPHYAFDENGMIEASSKKEL